MSKPIEVRLRVPRNSKEPLRDDTGYPLDTANVRFSRQMTLDAVPKAGQPIDLVAGGRTLQATVVRADWSDPDERFIVACQYAGRSISIEDQNALVADPDWTLIPLL